MAHGAPPKCEIDHSLQTDQLHLVTAYVPEVVYVAPVAYNYEAIQVVNHDYSNLTVTDRFAVLLPPEVYWRTRPTYLGKDLHYAGNDLIKNKPLGWKMIYPIKLC